MPYAMQNNNPSSALIVDWLDKFAGSERVISSMAKLIKFDEVHCLTSVMSNNDLNKTFNNQIPAIKTTPLVYLGRHFRVAVPFFSPLIRSVKINPSVKLVISSSHAAAKGVKKPKGAFHISYFQARNMKYIWEESNLYFNGVKRAMHTVIPILRKLDVSDAQQPDIIISNSKFVQKWVKSTYNRESILLYPPVNVDSFDIGPHNEEYFITVGRLEPYKRFDLIIEAFNTNGHRLFVVGDGSQRKHLESMARPNIHFTGYLRSEEINTLLGNARAFVYAGVEDFGISPVEAQATGLPVICLNAAGTAETVIEGLTGILFNEQSSDAIVIAVEKFIHNHKIFKADKIKNNALRFSEQIFLRDLRTIIESHTPWDTQNFFTETYTANHTSNQTMNT